MNSAFHFKGDRTYLHSTTMFDHLVRHVIGDRWIPEMIDFSFVRKTANQCAVLEKPAQPDADRVIARYRDSHSAFVFVESGEPISERVPFDEAAIVQHCIETGDGIRVPDSVPARYNFLERAIASYKHFLTGRFADLPGPWVVARFTLEAIPAGEFNIRYGRCISGTFFQSHILVEDSIIGTMVFGKDKS